MSHPNKWRNRLLIAMPMGELGYGRYAQHLLSGDVQHLGWHVDHRKVHPTPSGAYIQDTHNSVIEAALQRKDWDRLLWMEHDHEFPEDVLERHAQQTEPIVAGLYYGRNVQDPQPILYDWNEDRTAITRWQPWQVAKLVESPGLHKADCVPMGCTSIRRDVLEDWPEHIPFYAVATGKAKTAGIMGDDVWFCRHAQDQGHSIWIDSRIKCTHFGLVPLNESVYVGWVEKMKREGKTEAVKV